MRRDFLGRAIAAGAFAVIGGCSAKQGLPDDPLSDWPADWREETCRQVQAVLDGEHYDEKWGLFASVLVNEDASKYAEELTLIRRHHAELGKPKLSCVAYTVNALSGPAWVMDMGPLSSIEPTVAQVFVAPAADTGRATRRRDVLCAWIIVKRGSSKLACVSAISGK